MMSDYIDGVPLAISEKYILPSIQLSNGIKEQIDKSRRVIENLNYDCVFEVTVLEKLCELKNAKSFVENETKRRIQLYKETKQKMLDNKIEEKLRQLCELKVTYSSSHDDNNDNTKSAESAQEQSILKPIQVVSYNPNNFLHENNDHFNLIKKPSKLNKLKLSNVENLTFKDFEDDTSSPFDNVELKTINEMDILAEVLHKNKSAENDPSAEKDPSNNYYHNGIHQFDLAYLQQKSGPSYQTNVDDSIPNFTQHYYHNTVYSPYYNQNIVHSTKSKVVEIIDDLNIEIEKNKLNVLNVEKLYEDAGKTSSTKKRAEIEYSPGKLKGDLPNPYYELTSESKVLCDNIAGMGFPLERVARVCQLLGDNNDKKIIEALIAVGELMDLGFTECQVTSVLWKHNFNRDSALDELVG